MFGNLFWNVWISFIYAFLADEMGILIDQKQSFLVVYPVEIFAFKMQICVSG
jgi:hypothetical protein